VYGGFFMMAPLNEPIVRRAWGLRERHRREEAVKAGLPITPAPTFSYSEFLVTPNWIYGVALSLVVFTAAVVLALLPPARWLFRKMLPPRGEGPARGKLERGWFELTNVSEAEGVVVKSVVKGDGDPAYYLTACELFIKSWLIATY
jgi:hypothetical protein